MRPAGGYTGENVAFRRTAGSVLMIPMQLGPIIRMPGGADLLDELRLELPAAPPVSPKPALMTTSALTPFAMQSSTACETTCGAARR